MQQNNLTDETTPQDRGQTVVKTTEQITEVNPLSNVQPLSLEDKRFCSLVADGYSLTTAYRMAYPAKSKLKYSTVRANASKLLTNYNISTEVESKKQSKIMLARLAEDRLTEVLTDMRPGKTVADVAMFVYDHANGKATQRTEVISKSVSVNIDLTGKVSDTHERTHRQARTEAQA